MNENGPSIMAVSAFMSGVGFGSVVLITHIRPTLMICCDVSLCVVIFDSLFFPSHFGRLAAVFHRCYAFSMTPSK